MKLGEALALRADLQKRMHQVENLALENASVQEGDTPAVDPVALLAEYRRLAAEHEALVRRINRTNVGARIEAKGEALTLADAVVRRERLAREAKLLREVARGAMPSRNRYLRTEVKHVPAVDVQGVLADADRLSRAHRELDTLVQESNWQVEMIE
jgi:hypothetical protein